MAREGNDGTLAVATLNLKVFAVLVWCVLNPFHVSKAFLRDFGVNATAHSDYVRKHLHQKGQKGQEHVTDLRHTTLGTLHSV